MAVGIEYTLAGRHAPGAGRYVRELVRALVRLEDRPELALFEGGRRPHVLPSDALGLEDAAGVRRRHVAWPRRALEVAARVGHGPDRWLGGVELLHHAHANGLPSGRAPEVVPVAELPPPGTGRERVVVARLQRAARLLVFSAAMGERLRRLGVPEDRVVQVPVGADHWARDLPAAPARLDPPVVLVLGAVREARGQHLVLAACERLRARGVEVALDVLGRAGDPLGPFATALAASPMRGAVGIAVPPEAELPARVAGASVLVHLEDDPGTPVTPLEAMALGVPVVATRAPAFVEALGDAARFVDAAEVARDVPGLADAIEGALAASPEHVARGRAAAARYTWRANAEATVEAWRALTSPT